MQSLISADQKTSDWQRAEKQTHAESAFAAIWFVLYLVALGVAIASPYVSDAVELAARYSRTFPVKMRQISYFLALCEEQSFTRAARRSGVAQPSLMRAIPAKAA